MNKIKLLILLCPLTVFADEPGLLRNESPPPRAQPPAVPAQATEAVVTQMNLKQDFARAKGLTEEQVQNLHFNRVACARRIYSQGGWSVEGDADLKITAITEDLYEAEFPSQLSLAGFDPYQNGIDRIETVVSRQLLNFSHWTGERTLRLFKSVNVSYVDPNMVKQTAYAMDEFKVLGDTYPPTFIVKETISAKTKFAFYFICQ